MWVVLLFLIQVWFSLIIKNYNLAQQICKRFIKNNSIEPLFHEYLGLVYKKKGEILKAIEEYKKAIELYPHSLTNKLTLIALLYQVEDYREVVKIGSSILLNKQKGYLENLKKVFFENLYWYLAFSHFNLSNFQEALSFFEMLTDSQYIDRPEVYKCINECRLRLQK
jgi:tetratricopeptide (TPR) repeat protein